MSIATTTGDRGDTSLIGNTRISKADGRVEAYGTIDELGATLAFARSLCTNELLRKETEHIQRTLFRVGAILATPAVHATPDTTGTAPAAKPSTPATLTSEDVDHLTTLVHTLESKPGILADWSLPGAHTGAAAYEIARTVCRRAERYIVRLQESGAPVDAPILAYINRLSDVLWLFARVLEQEAGIDSRLRDDAHPGPSWSRAW